MEDMRPAAKNSPGDSWWTDPRVSNFLMIATYMLGSAGVALGIFGLISGGGPKALHYSLPLAVGAMGVLTLIRHGIFHVSDARRAGVDSDPFYMIELGFANGAIGVLALVVFFGEWGVAAEAVLMLVYALYLGLAFFIFSAHARQKGLDSGKIISLCMWIVQVGFMFYFAIAASIAESLPPF